MARLLHFPSGRRLDGPASEGMFLAELGWASPLPSEPPPRSRLVGFLPHPIDLNQVAARTGGDISPRSDTAERFVTVAPARAGARRLTLFATARPCAAPISALDPALLEPAARATGFLAADTELPSDDPLGQFQLQIRIALAAADALVWYDTLSQRWLDAARLRLLAEAPARPAAAELLDIHRVSGRADRCWLHTHGLQRAGVPDLEMFSLAPRSLGIATRVLHMAAAHLLEYGAPRPGRPLPVSREVDLWLQPLASTLAALPRGTVGKSSRHRGRSEHRGFRGALVADPAAPGRGQLLDRLLLRAERGGSLLRPPGETERLRLLARHSLPSLLALWQVRAPTWMIAIEIGHPSGPDARSVDHLWFEPLAMDARGATARLLSPPPDLQPWQPGQILELDWTQLTDWYVHDGDRRYGPLEPARSSLPAPGEPPR